MSLRDRAIAAVLDERAARRVDLADGAVEVVAELLDLLEDPIITGVDVDGGIVRLTVDELHFKVRVQPMPGAQGKQKRVLEVETKPHTWKPITSLVDLGQLLVEQETTA